MLTNKKGISLIIVIFVMLLFAVMGWSLVILQSGDFEATLRQADGERAFYLAEAGLQHGMRKLADDNNWRTTGETYTLSPGQYTVSSATGTAGQVTITGTGYIPSTTNYRAMRQVQATVMTTPWDRAIDAVNLFDWSEMHTGSYIEGKITAAEYDGDGDTTYSELNQDWADSPNGKPPPLVDPHSVILTGWRELTPASMPSINLAYYKAKAQLIYHYIDAPYIYVADYSSSGTAGLKIINNIPSSPTLKGSSPNFTYAYGVHGYFYKEISHNDHYFTCVAAGTNGLKILDVTTATAPTVYATLATTCAYGVFTDVGEAFAANYAYVADGASGLRVVDISSPGSASIEGTYNTSGTAYDVYVRGSYAYVADGASGLQIIDISDPASPILTGTYNTTGDSRGVYVRGRHAFVADGTNGTRGLLQIINASSPASPTLRATVDLPVGSCAYDLYVKGRYVYVACGTAGLQIVEISELPNSQYVPAIVGSYNPADGNEAKGIHISGDYAYISFGTPGLCIVDISNPTAPSLVSTRDTDYAAGVFVLGDKSFDGNHNNDQVWYTIGNIWVKGGNYQHTTFIAEGDIEMVGSEDVAFKAHVVPSANENFPNMATEDGSIIAADHSARSFDGLLYTKHATIDINGLISEGVLMAYDIFLDGDIAIEYDAKYVGTPPDGFLAGVSILTWHEI